jgi:hypothetical protein
VTRLRGDAGQLATTVMMIVTVALTAVLVFGVLPLGAGSNEKSLSQTAADAAALAAAEQIRDDALDLFAVLDDKDDIRVPMPSGSGQAEAVVFADRNGASVTSYSYNWLGDRIEVTVANNDTVNDRTGVARSRAVAAFGLPFGSCSFDDDAAPPPPPPDPPVPDPPEPPDSGTTLRCGGFTARFEIDGDTGLLSLETDLEILRNRLEPRLVE